MGSNKNTCSCGQDSAICTGYHGVHGLPTMAMYPKHYNGKPVKYRPTNLMGDPPLPATCDYIPYYEDDDGNAVDLPMWKPAYVIPATEIRDYVIYRHAGHGWICPVCGRGLAPTCMECPCKGKDD